MHELGLTMEIVDVVVARAAGRPVRRVRIAVGRLAAVVPEALRFCFELCAKDTAADGAAFEIDIVPGRALCRGCHETVPLERPWGRCACGGEDLEVISGHELVVVEMEVE